MSLRANRALGRGAGDGRRGYFPFFHAPRPSPLAPDDRYVLTTERGIALLIVVSVLTVVGIMGVAFAFSMYLETQATREFVSTSRARYVAESGVNHARALLDEDRFTSRIDSVTEHWGTDGTGSDVDVDGDSTRESRWRVLSDADRRFTGRYAFEIIDEAGKANLNAGLAHPAPDQLGAIDLTTLCEQAGVADPGRLAEAIEAYRNGDDRHPGKAGVDDNGNGQIDEPEEYQPLALQGDDRRLESLEDLIGIAQITTEDVRRLARVATVYSWDLNASVTGKARVNINAATASELLPVLFEVGVSDPWQVAVNMADAVDPDFEMSRLTKSSQTVSLTSGGSVTSHGEWIRTEEPVVHYRSSGPGGQPLVWTLDTPPQGSFRILAHGLAGTKVGDVTIAGQLKPSLDDGASVGVFDVSGPLTITVANHEAEDVFCAIRSIEFVSESAQSGVLVRGIEAIRFHEIMVQPTVEFLASAAAFHPRQGSGWQCPLGSTVCSSTGAGKDDVTWEVAPGTGLPVGPYYVRLFGSSGFDEVCINNRCEPLANGQRHAAQITLGGKKIELTLGKSLSDKTYYLTRVELSLAPDAEYVELINLSDQPVDLHGWTIATADREARFPDTAAAIGAHGILVAAVDADDHQEGLGDNGISARDAWEVPGTIPIVPLTFPGGAPTPEDTWLKAKLPDGGWARLTLKTREGLTVDEVEYPPPDQHKSTFLSLEKGDPTVMLDDNENGIDEGWFPSSMAYTPGQANRNDGLTEQRGELEPPKVHDPTREITILNRSLNSVGELAGLPSGTAWKPFATTELASVVDRLTVEGYRLEAEGHLEQGGDAWDEKGDGSYVHTDPKKSSTSGRWQWRDLLDGHYRMSLYSCQGCQGEQFSLRWQREDGSWTSWSPPLSTDAQGRLFIGEVTIGMGETASGLLTLEAMCVSPSGICHCDYARLDPRLMRVGPVNINTAPEAVLLSLPGMTEAMASRVIANRPYGDQDQKGRGIGDLLVTDVFGSEEEDKLRMFRQLAHLLTTRSDVFQILSLGQATARDRVEASQRVKTVVQR